ncbi:helix-turn-helix domain-containing protein [Streptomonospora wellingtoniae]|uniref:Helix-turn-helix transcriptional regulator n=1 Tax=Streptomonospora wellingtoniae TaxID=3075544 RepID=A0ABU2KV26_9ACTN|nr:helix-turn-helix transcriptional regulator [Streptomonospora sp. DSM 45055]MDT0303022.1 helix-turn-helix transcriptional regulator [Streptomonospora sp. DSM 45055]
MVSARTEEPVGVLLRHWRARRGLSQLALSGLTGVSTRHLSFVETGRSAPSRGLVLRLCDHLDLGLRERNRVLLAAGYAPAYPETPLDDPQMAAVRTAVGRMLTGHEPYPAVVVDRRWDMLEANAGIALFTGLVADHLLSPPVNVLRASLHPEGMAPRIANLGEWRAHLLGRLQRQAEITDAADLRELYAELRSYPGGDGSAAERAPGGPGDFVVPLRLRHGDRELSFFSAVATLGTPVDVTLAELVVESFFPADADTADFLVARGRADAGAAPPAG